jgi:hypothetical protein
MRLFIYRWKQHKISYGVSLVGTIEVWFKRRFLLEIVSNSIPETGSNRGEIKDFIFRNEQKAII